MRYIIFDTEQEAIDLSTSLWDMVTSDGTNRLMFSVRPNIDSSKWALMVNSKFNSKLRIQSKITKFNNKHDLKLTKRKLNISSVLNTKFTLVNPNSLDQTEWGFDLEE